jgi:hypothetical protein
MFVHAVTDCGTLSEKTNQQDTYRKVPNLELPTSAETGHEIVEQLVKALGLFHLPIIR